jgi:hypothetical protein
MLKTRGGRVSEHRKNRNASKQPTEIDKTRSREREYRLVD